MDKVIRSHDLRAGKHLVEKRKCSDPVRLRRIEKRIRDMKGKMRQASPDMEWLVQEIRRLEGM